MPSQSSKVKKFVLFSSLVSSVLHNILALLAFEQIVNKKDS